ncbi:primase P4 [Nostoc sp. NIES-3756]|uniref:DNA primase family protein n=1 Tax=Nostoc sp. NIES-3756 TaxID=1751286 RepID=UPI0007204FCE|nr:phage/plasmid primase, P4 family [Nostoc sp. NIES-3756]BAT55135.1 primase P4 [Nostoc sp. NIES-3756]
MINNYYNQFPYNQDEENNDLQKEEYCPAPLLMPIDKDINQHIQPINDDITVTSKYKQDKQGLNPKPDIIGRDIAEQYKNKLLFNSENSCWMIYGLENDGVWKAVNDHYIERLINDELKQRQIAGYSSHSYITNIICKMRMELTEQSWQAGINKNLLPFQNCILDITTGNILNHSPKYKFTWCLSRNFETFNNGFITIDKWFDEATNNNGSIKEILLCYLAAILKGRADLQQFLHLIGSGGTGKSTFIGLAQSLIGSNNVCTATLRDFCGNKFGAANAYGKRLVVFPDQDKYNGDLQKFKSLTGQDEILAEEKFKQPFQFKFDGMVIMASNLPVFNCNNSSWLTRRQILIPFNNPVDKSKRRDLEKEFQPELNALTQYLLNIPNDQVTQILRNAVDNPELAQHNLEQQIASNSIAAWINECIIRDVNSNTQIGSNKADSNTLFGNYSIWCRNSGSTPDNLRSFSQNILDFCNSAMGWNEIKKARNSKGYYIRGLRLRELGKDDDISSPLISVESQLHSEG